MGPTSGDGSAARGSNGKLGFFRRSQTGQCMRGWLSLKVLSRHAVTCLFLDSRCKKGNSVRDESGPFLG